MVHFRVPAPSLSCFLLHYMLAPLAAPRVVPQYCRSSGGQLNGAAHAVFLQHFICLKWKAIMLAEFRIRWGCFVSNLEKHREVLTKPLFFF